MVVIPAKSFDLVDLFNRIAALLKAIANFFTSSFWANAKEGDVKDTVAVVD